MIIPNSIYIITAFFFSMLLGTYAHPWSVSVVMILFSIFSGVMMVSDIR